MCGIIAVLRRKSLRGPSSPQILDAAVTMALAALARDPQEPGLAAAAEALAGLDRELRGVPGIQIGRAHV